METTFGDMLKSFSLKGFISWTVLDTVALMTFLGGNEKEGKVIILIHISNSLSYEVFIAC